MPNVVSPKIKFCGICSPTDAEVSVEFGAQYLGLIFVKSSPRYIEPVAAQAITASVQHKVQVVGVFQDSSAEEMEGIASFVGLDYFQLHGNESPALCKSLSKPVIKAFQVVYKSQAVDRSQPVDESQPVERSVADQPCTTLSFSNLGVNKDVDNIVELLEQYRPYCQHFLFDRPKKNFNSDWLDFASQSLASVENQLGDYFLAGGLNASNIQRAMLRLSPAVVDIASGVEKTVRIKDKGLMAEFCSTLEASRKDGKNNGSFSSSRGQVINEKHW
jgi:phosphoribosylanthranilate isomerase